VLLYFFDLLKGETDNFTFLGDAIRWVVAGFAGLMASALELRAIFLDFFVQLDNWGVNIMDDDAKEQTRLRADRYRARAEEMRRMSDLDFGNYLEGRLEDEENTKAVEANTQAIRDLSREFRNLPSGYKIASADFATSRPPGPGGSGTLSGAAGAYFGERSQMSDFYRGRR
jgi:hypothetical protein